MKRLLIRFALWLLRVCDYKPEVNSTYALAAFPLCQEQQEKWPERSGEGKRHAVYAALIKLFPEASHRSLSRAIEDAIDAS